MTNKLYSTFDVMRKLGIKRERLRTWIDNDFIPMHTKAKGRGTKTLFTHDNLYSIKMFMLLLGSGFKRSMASEIVKSKPKGWKDTYVFPIGDDKITFVIINMLKLKL